MVELTHAYLKRHKVGYLEQDLADIREQFNKMAERQNKLSGMTRRPKVTPRDLMEASGLTEEHLRDQAKYKNLFDQFDEDAISAFIKANPSFFDGTQVQIKHIFIVCSPLAPTTHQKAAITMLEKIKADILSGKITFEESVRKYSASFNPEAKDEDLRMFGFSQMIPSLSVGAFRTKVGEMSDIVRTNYGFYLLKVTKRINGNAEPGPSAMTIAVRAWGSQVLNKIYDQALTTAPIVIYRKPPKP